MINRIISQPFYNYPIKRTPFQEKGRTLDFGIRDTFVKSTNPNNVSFCGKAEKTKDVMHDGVYREFMRDYVNAYGDIPLDETARKIFQTTDCLNYGKDKRVYDFPKLDNYVIAHLYHKEPLDSPLPIEQAQITFPKYNFSEPFATNNHDIMIFKKIHGVSNSVDDYHGSSEYLCRNGSATRKMAEEYLSKLELFKDFGQSSYDDFLQQIEYLVENGQFVDFANPNNLLIGSNEETIQLIDLLSQKNCNLIRGLAEQHKTKAKTPGLYDAISLLLDPRFQCYYMDYMTDEEKETVKKISENAIKKLIKATDKTSLTKEPDLVEVVNPIIVEVEPHLNENFYNRYNECLDLYKNVLDKA